MKTLIIAILLVILILLFVMFAQPQCPKCRSKDIGLFRFRGKRVFCCHSCGHKDSETEL
jgi:transposase-like protein